MIELLRHFKERGVAFEKDAHQILSKHESSKSRVISLDQTRRFLVGLSLQQDELFQQSLACIEDEIYRAAHVMGWAAFMDFLEQKLASDGLTKLKSVRPAWNKFTTIEEIRENLPEYQLIEVARDVKLLSKSETKIILGLLSKRNECAHPSNYRPDLNETLGYVAELLKRTEHLNNKSL
ncbi:MAG: hypothetical protein PHU34_07090 [Candidatus Methanoperedens sp.]|nr:hypothetical protein [Candidatus Methanoperedens sp.]